MVGHIILLVTIAGLAVCHALWLYRAMVARSEPGVILSAAVVMTLFALTVLYGNLAHALCSRVDALPKPDEVVTFLSQMSWINR